MEVNLTQEESLHSTVGHRRKRSNIPEILFGHTSNINSIGNQSCNTSSKKDKNYQKFRGIE